MSSEITNDTNYNSTCTPSGNWSRLDGCSFIYCKPLQFEDNGSVEKVVEVVVEGMENILNTTITASCKHEGEDFDFGFNILYVEYHCGYRSVNQRKKQNNVKLVKTVDGKCPKKMPVLMVP